MVSRDSEFGFMDSPVSELIDTHAHLASQVFREPGELPALLDRAFEAGVTRIISIASDLEDSHRNTEIASEYGGVFATVGVHPTSVHEVTQQGWIGTSQPHHRPEHRDLPTRCRHGAPVGPFYDPIHAPDESSPVSRHRR